MCSASKLSGLTIQIRCVPVDCLIHEPPHQPVVFRLWNTPNAILVNNHDCTKAEIHDLVLEWYIQDFEIVPGERFRWHTNIIGHKIDEFLDTLTEERLWILNLQIC